MAIGNNIYDEAGVAPAIEEPIMPLNIKGGRYLGSIEVRVEEEPSMPSDYYGRKYLWSP